MSDSIKQKFNIKKKKNTKEKEEYTMTTMVKPNKSIYAINLDPNKKEEFEKNSASEDFLVECKQIMKKLTKSKEKGE